MARPRFRTSRNRRSRALRSWWTIWRVPTLVMIVAAVWWFAFRPSMEAKDWVEVDAAFSLCGEGARTQGCVIDGDTLLLNRPGERPARIRLTGFDAPELDGACPAESEAAQRARRALAEWLEAGPFEWDGGADPPRDQYGRELRAVRRVTEGNRSETLADSMIERGLAGESGWGTFETDWCAP